MADADAHRHPGATDGQLLGTASRMALVNELEEDLSTDVPAQTLDTLRQVNAGSYLTFNEVLSFPKPERRPHWP